MWGVSTTINSSQRCEIKGLFSGSMLYLTILPPNPCVCETLIRNSRWMKTYALLLVSSAMLNQNFIYIQVKWFAEILWTDVSNNSSSVLMVCPPRRLIRMCPMHVATIQRKLLLRTTKCYRPCSSMGRAASGIMDGLHQTLLGHDVH